MTGEVEDRLRDLEDGFITAFALVAAQNPECIDGHPATAEEIAACQQRFIQCLERIKERFGKR